MQRWTEQLARQASGPERCLEKYLVTITIIRRDEISPIIRLDHRGSLTNVTNLTHFCSQRRPLFANSETSAGLQMPDSCPIQSRSASVGWDPSTLTGVTS